jgi:hypothetical protein
VPLLAVPAVTVITPFELARDLFQWVHDEEVVDALYLQVGGAAAAAAAATAEKAAGWMQHHKHLEAQRTCATAAFSVDMWFSFRPGLTNASVGCAAI